ncbi:MAG TPA: SDR family oxidoreductase [Planctomycetota bacterium]|jgi:UDP-N-acetylglucosamine 4-epimerase
MPPIPFESAQRRLTSAPRRWLITGVAGFIGSNLLHRLLSLQQEVVGLDNFATGSRKNLDDVRTLAGEQAWSHFKFIDGDISDLRTCEMACAGVDYVLHQAALGSVPRSIDDPLASHRANVNGTVNMLQAARKAGVQRFVYASSSSVYGDEPTLPKVEDQIGNPLSPYALTKSINEQYAAIYARCYASQVIGLRYFNVFGRRQDPAGAYAAVIPKWIDLLLKGDPCTINGDGSVSRDFCYVENVVQANVLAATVEDPRALDKVYNIACGVRTTLNELFALLRDGLAKSRPQLAGAQPKYGSFRRGDIPHSLANISRARELLGYEPTHSIAQGLDETLAWYVANCR